MKMVLGRTYVLSTTKGHSIRFIKGESVNVPEICVPDAVAVGAVPADGSDPNVIVEEKKTYDGPNDPTVREKEVIAGIELLVEQNARKDFTAAGVPATDALSRTVGFDVGSAERNAMWQKYNDKKAEQEAA